MTRTNREMVFTDDVRACYSNFISITLKILTRKKIVEEGGFHALLMLLESTGDSTAIRITTGAIANLAMNEYNAIDIISRGGIKESCVYQTESSKEDMLSLAKKALNSEPGIPGKD
ncbi:hypothetical protein M6B38_324980 [Iris pallida]|uniref:Uncharacterized protein n=1 Tax=Iris pallida TaxID=29817 RepID=A0AAX6H790_IRIPA|nr:hypothetical protein M6B38_324980 [Iris pallida]